jgi:hypothetical protein
MITIIIATILFIVAIMLVVVDIEESAIFGQGMFLAVLLLTASHIVDVYGEDKRDDRSAVVREVMKNVEITNKRDEMISNYIDSIRKEKLDEVIYITD